MQTDCFHRFKGSPQYKTFILDAAQWAVSRPAARANQQLATLSVLGPSHLGKHAKDDVQLSSIQEVDSRAIRHSHAVRGPLSASKQSGSSPRPPLTALAIAIGHHPATDRQSKRQSGISLSGQGAPRSPFVSAGATPPHGSPKSAAAKGQLPS